MQPTTRTAASKPRKLVLAPETVRKLTAPPSADAGRLRATVFDPRSSRITCTR